MTNRTLLLCRSCINAGLKRVRANRPDYLDDPELAGAAPDIRDQVAAVVCVTMGAEISAHD